MYFSVVLVSKECIFKEILSTRSLVIDIIFIQADSIHYSHIQPIVKRRVQMSSPVKKINLLYLPRMVKIKQASQKKDSLRERKRERERKGKREKKENQKDQKTGGLEGQNASRLEDQFAKGQMAKNRWQENQMAGWLERQKSRQLEGQRTIRHQFSQLNMDYQ